MTTFRVSNQSQLNSALSNVKNGDTILLASGTYNSIQMQTNRRTDHDFSSKVTIASADPNNPAKVNSLKLADVSNVEFRDLVFDYVYGKSSNKPFFAERSEKITFDNIDFDGHIRNGFGSALGLRVKDSSQITVSDSDFHDFQNALSFSNVDDVRLTDNLVRNMSNDGFTFGGISRILIEDNTFRNFKSPDPAAQHKDNIQFRATSDEAPSDNIVIRGNQIDSAEVRHGIYIGNELYKAGNLYAMHRNILIEDNYVRSAQLHGITVLHGNGVTVRDNTLVQNPDGGFRANVNVNVPLINVSIYSHDVTITGNRVASVQKEQDSSWDIYNNYVGSKQYLHWPGDYGFKKGPDISRIESAAASAAPLSDGHSADGQGSSGQADAAKLRFGGALADGDSVVDVDGIDFSRGDSFVFNDWNSGTFQDKAGGNVVDDWNHGASVKVDSLLDLQELVHFSPAVTAETDGADLILTIDQGSRGSAEFHISGVAAGFLAANQPDLF